ncbi:MAG TPA: ATP-binding protein [Thermoanaerobaculaceae bacterium]|nr:ATP-binding protein [Thermoanaerobaculaceae bacterium]
MGEGNGLPQGLTLTATQEVAASSRWLIGMRWVAGAAAIAGAWLVRRVLLPGLGALPLMAAGALVLGANAAFGEWNGRLVRGGGERPGYRRLLHAQLVFDWTVMLLLIHLTGGVESPLLPVFVFHVVVASLVFERWTALAYAASAAALAAALATAEATGVIAHRHVAGLMPGEAYRHAPYAVLVLGSFWAVSALAWAVTSSVAARVRRREDQLASLVAGVQAVNSTLELKEVLDRLVRATVDAMGVQGASIGLLDLTGAQVELASSYGLSEAYLNKGPVLVSQSPAHRQALIEGKAAIIQSEAERSRLQYPAAAEAENIRSMLFVPLKGKWQPLGVVRAYSSREEAFGAEDVRFLEAIAAQGAIAIENAIAYQALQKLDEQKSKFTRTVTHELRAPVTGAQTLVSLIIDGYAGPLEEKQAGFLVRLRRRLETLQQLIDDLMSLAAGRSGLTVEEVVPIGVLELVEKVVAQAGAQAEGKKQTLLVERGDGAERLKVEATIQGLGRIFGNLVGNAVKYTPEGGRVTVTVEPTGSQAAVRVADTGIGIPAQSQGRLFTEFFRAPNAMAVESGTGLGLVIVKELVERFRGRIVVESQEGAGSTFTVFLPLTDA